jgi:hypothetical protein
VHAVGHGTTWAARVRRNVSTAALLCGCLIVAGGVLAPLPATAGSYEHGYTRKNGTYVAPHDSGSPGPGGYRHPSSHSSAGSSRTRDPEERRAFMHTHPCPSTGKTSGACPGYVVDHITPLKRGGADRPSNMQWQTLDAAKAKDRWE